MTISKKSELLTSILLAMTGAVLLVSLFGYMRFNIDALQFRVTVQFNEKGYTEVEIPPLGTVRAHTHTAPLLVSVRLENIDLQLIQRLLSDTTERNEVVEQSKTVLQQVAVIFVIKLIGLAMLGGALGVFLTRKGNLKNIS